MVMKIVVCGFTISDNMEKYYKYNEGIVNKAMCMYLRPQYLVD